MSVPTSRQKSVYWFVRSDGPESFLRQKCGELSQSLDVVAMLAAFHKGKTGENPHVHFTIEFRNERQKQSIDDRLKKLFEVKGAAYSSKLWDGQRGAGACSYLFHEEDPPILVNKGYTDEELLAAKAANEAVQKVVAVNKEKASQKLVERALVEFDGRQPSRYDILEFMLKECKDGKAYYPGSFMIKKFVEEVELRLVDDGHFPYYVQSMLTQLWRN